MNPVGRQNGSYERNDIGRGVGDGCDDPPPRYSQISDISSASSRDSVIAQDGSTLGEAFEALVNVQARQRSASVKLFFFC